MSNVYPVVVDTIHRHFVRYRGLKILEPVDASRISKILDKVGYIRIDAERLTPRGARKHVIILVLDESKKYCHNSPELKKLMESIDNDPHAKNDTLDEVILVVDTPFKNKKNLMEIVKGYQEKEQRGPDLAGKTPFYTVIDNINMRSAIPEHEIVPKYELMTADEQQEFLAFQMKTVTNFPRILNTDPQMLWIGGRAGQMVKLLRVSDATCEALDYKIIVAGNF